MNIKYEKLSSTKLTDTYVELGPTMYSVISYSTRFFYFGICRV